jgi:type II secretory ATPase GspE/PulE/Tfp pilus assembly ATPase PilB-like protein
MSPQIRELILRRAPERDVQNAAHKEGMKTLREQGLAKAAAHITTLEEVFRTTIGEAVGE